TGTSSASLSAHSTTSSSRPVAASSAAASPRCPEKPQTDVTSYDVIVLGAGAAGLMCALVAGPRGRCVLVLQRSDPPGKKILISGGGRCNFTNLHTAPENFISANPDFARSALARFTPQDFIAMVESHAIPYHEKKLGQLFCDGSARAVLEMLLAKCANASV